MSIASLVGLFLEQETLYSSYFFFVALFYVSACALLTVYHHKKGGDGESTFFVKGLFLFLFVALGILRGQFISEKTPEISELFEKRPLTFYIEERKIEENSLLYTASFECNKKTYMGQLRTDLYPRFEIGDTVIATTSLQEENILFNDDKTKGVPSSLFAKKNDIVGTFWYPQLVKSEGKELTFHAKRMRLKENMETTLHTLVPGREGDLVSALLFGSSALTKAENKLFQQAGISHIVALSGFNITIIVLFLSTLLFFLPFWVRVILSSSFVLSYLSLTEMSGSLLRASIMALLSLLILLRGSAIDHKKSLALSFLFIIFLFPESARDDASLHLSCLALLGVFFIYPILFEKYVHSFMRWKRVFLEAFLSACAVLLLVAPYALYRFESFTPYGVIATVLVTFFVPILTVLCLLAVTLGYVSSFFVSLLKPIIFVLAHSIFFIADLVTVLPFSSLHVLISFTSLLLYYIVLSLFLYCLQTSALKNMKNKDANVLRSDDSEVIEDDMYF